MFRFSPKFDEQIVLFLLFIQFQLSASLAIVVCCSCHFNLLMWSSQNVCGPLKKKNEIHSKQTTNQQTIPNALFLYFFLLSRHFIRWFVIKIDMCALESNSDFLILSHINSLEISTTSFQLFCYNICD